MIVYLENLDKNECEQKEWKESVVRKRSERKQLDGEKCEKTKEQQKMRKVGKINLSFFAAE